MQAAFGPSRLVFVNDVATRGAVQLLGGDPQFGLGFLQVPGLDGLADPAKLAPHVAFHGPVMEAAFLVLSEPFFGTSGIGHGVKRRRRASCGKGSNSGADCKGPRNMSRSVDGVQGDARSSARGSDRSRVAPPRGPSP